MNKLAGCLAVNDIGYKISTTGADLFTNCLKFLFGTPRDDYFSSLAGADGGYARSCTCLLYTSDAADE